MDVQTDDVIDVKLDKGKSIIQIDILALLFLFHVYMRTE